MSNSLADPRNILAGSKAAGTRGTSLVWARNADDSASTAETEPNTADKAFDDLDASYTDMGQCDTKGTSLKQNVSTNPIKSFGSLAPQGNLYTDYTGTAEVTFQETTPYTFAIYRSLPLGSVTANEEGVFGGGVGLPIDCRYQTVFDGFSQHGDAMRFYLPNSANTEPGDLNMQMGEVMDRPITLTMYPDAKGNLFYEWYMLKNLVSATSGTGGTLTASPASKTLTVGATQQVTVSQDSNDVTGSCTFTSSKASVATVNSTGLVTAVGAGSATITASKGGANVTVSITVTS